MVKKVPMRMCVACRTMKPKRELMRVVRPPADAEAGEAKPALLLDATGKANGRGAYICADAACVERAQKTRALERALGCPVEAPFYDDLKEYCGAG